MASLVTYARAVVLVPALGSLPQAQVEAYLDAATESIEEACGRGFAKQAVTAENTRPDQFGRSWIWRAPVDPTETVTVTDNAGTAISFLLENERGELITPGVIVGDIVKVTYTGGMTLIPPAVELAVANQAKRRIDRGSQAGAVTSKKIGSVEVQYEARAETATVDEDILASIAKYIRKGLR